MCESAERNLRAVFAIEQMMGSWCLDLAAIKQILTGTDCRHNEGGHGVQPDQATTTP
jgi:truncated hemoglobin YjbI